MSADYFAEDTIAAIAAATGGALSILRVSGPRAHETLLKLSRVPDLSKFQPRSMTRVLLRNPSTDALLDDALAARFDAPRSYTGEDCVEYFLHGGSFVAERVLEAIVSLGARQALPGEFSFRAVRNGRLTLSQAQAVSEVISASNDGALALALEKLSGTQQRLFSELAEELRQLAALAELGIDFSDQDIDEVSLSRLIRKIPPLIGTLERLENSFDRGTRLQEGFRIALIGLPNVGKSSFFNAILGENRSIVSEIAGTTRDLVRERITLRGKSSSITLNLEDTAGLRASLDPIEREGIQRATAAARKADLVLLLVEASSSSKQLMEIEASWNSILSGTPHPPEALGIFTKLDLVGTAPTPTSFRGIRQWIATSTQNGQGLRETVEQLVSLCEAKIHRSPQEVLLTRLDHLRAVREALEHLNRARLAQEPAFLAADLRQALHSLGPIIGVTLADDLLTRIFTGFCIGK